VVPECERDAETAAGVKPFDWGGAMKSGFRVTGVLLLSFSALAQQAVTIPVPGPAKRPAKPIQGDLYGSGTRGVILTHGGGRTKESWRKQAQVLAVSRFLVLAINFRSDTTNDKGMPISVGSDEDNAIDVLAAAAYLRAHGAKSISGVGASMGGYALAEADSMSKPEEFDRIVLLATTASDSATLQGRKLFILARDDVSSSGPRLGSISDSYAKALQPKELVILEGSAHAQSLFDTDQGPRLMSEILRFLTAP
jgi:pimeloyl-ACP methyl ester carboxylesterase